MLRHQSRTTTCHRGTPREERVEHRHQADVFDAVVASPLFRGVPLVEIADFLDAFDADHFRPGQRIVVEGYRGSDFFLIVEGVAEVAHAGWNPVLLGPGDSFGEVGVLSDGRRVGSIRALTALHCLVLGNGDLEPLLLRHPRIAVNLARAMVERFHKLTGDDGIPVRSGARG